MNQVGLVGRLTKDPNFRIISDSKQFVTFVLAVSRSFKNSQGKVDADFVLCVAWGKLAERIDRFCGKGSLVGINGRLQTRSYLNKDNIQVYTTEVVVEDIRFYQLKEKRTKLEEQGLPSIEELAENFEAPTEQILTT